MIASHRPPRRVVANATSCNKRTALRDVVEWGVGALAPPTPNDGVGAASPLRGRSYIMFYTNVRFDALIGESDVTGRVLKSLHVLAGWKLDFPGNAKFARGAYYRYEPHHENHNLTSNIFISHFIFSIIFSSSHFISKNIKKT